MNISNKANTVDVIREIKNTHKKLIVHELPLLEQLIQNALRADGPDHPVEIQEAKLIFGKLRTLLSAHLDRESREVFPVILRHQDERAQLSDAVVGVTDMITEHDAIVDLFTHLRQITNQYRPDQSMSFETRQVLEKLAEFEKSALDLIRYETDHAYAGIVCLATPTTSW